MENKAKEILAKYNQTHIIKWLEQVDENTRKHIVDQVFDIDFEELKSLYETAKSKREKKECKIEPIRAIDEKKISEIDKENYIKIGNTILNENKFAVITMAGGQGTRLRT